MRESGMIHTRGCSHVRVWFHNIIGEGMLVASYTRVVPHTHTYTQHINLVWVWR